MKLAVVYDRVNKFGGAERVLLAIHEIWPEAPLYTAVYNAERASWAKVFKVKPSFLQVLPGAKNHHELYPWLTPLAFETLNLDKYEVIISVTSAEAKDIITKPQTLHICYCLTPTRYLWSAHKEYLENPGLGRLNSLAKMALATLTPTLRKWDLVGAARPDYYLAISETVRQRIKQYYQREVEKVIYPPVDLEKFKIRDQESEIRDENNYFLTVARLVSYKRLDIIIKAFQKLGWPLVIIGDGLAKETLVNQDSDRTYFVSAKLTDQELVDYYQNCRAFVFAGREDFGLVAAEAQACGRPVIAFAEDGIGEVVRDKITGLLYREQSVNGLIDALRQFAKMKFNSEVCRKNAERFSTIDFKKEMRETVEELFKRYKNL